MRRQTAALALLVFVLPCVADDGRIEISQIMVPYEISTSGSYVLTENLSVTGANDTAILIETNNVSIDLNGFVISGPDVGTGSGAGIGATNRMGISVCNGFVTGFGSSGIDLESSAYSTVSGVQAFDNRAHGIALGSGIVSDCQVFDNGTDGIHMNSGIAKGNVSTLNGDDGIELNEGVIRSNTSSTNDYGIYSYDTAVVAGNLVFKNAKNGVLLSGFADSGSGTVVDNVARLNGTDQFSLENCLVSGNAAYTGTGAKYALSTCTTNLNH